MRKYDSEYRVMKLTVHFPYFLSHIIFETQQLRSDLQYVTIPYICQYYYFDKQQFMDKNQKNNPTQSLKPKDYSTQFTNATKTLLIQMTNQATKKMKDPLKKHTLRKQFKEYQKYLNSCNQQQQQSKSSLHQSRACQIHGLEQFQQLSIEQKSNEIQCSQQKKYLKFANLIEDEKELRKEQQLQTQGLDSKEQSIIHKKIKLFDLSLFELVVLFLQQIYQGSHQTIVHKKIKEDISIQKQLQNLQAYIEDSIERKVYGTILNEDRFIMLNERKEKGVVLDLFGEEIVTAYEHRGLAMLLKRINRNKYSVSLPTSNQMNEKRSFYQFRCLKSPIQIKFYQQQYKKSVQQYYKQLLQIQLQNKRYNDRISENQKLIIGAEPKFLKVSNFVRKLLSAVFEEKIKDKRGVNENILSLEKEIDIQKLAEDMLNTMRGQKQEGLQQGGLEVKYKAKQGFKKQLSNFNQESYSLNHSENGSSLPDCQKKAIREVLQHYKKNIKDVPYPYCLFVQYRLNATRKGNTGQFPYLLIDSNDENDDEFDKVAKKRDKARKMNCYSGYKGLKTTSRVSQIKRRNKNIMINAKEFSKMIQQPKLKFPAKFNEKIQELQSRNVEVPKQQDDENQVQIIPFPYNLPIFTPNIRKSILKNQEESEENSSFFKSSKSTNTQPVVDLTK